MFKNMFFKKNDMFPQMVSKSILVLRFYFICIM